MWSLKCPQDLHFYVPFSDFSASILRTRMGGKTRPTLPRTSRFLGLKSWVRVQFYQKCAGQVGLRV
jgi:hypothetical protein